MSEHTGIRVLFGLGGALVLALAGAGRLAIAQATVIRAGPCRSGAERLVDGQSSGVAALQNGSRRLS